MPSPRVALVTCEKFPQLHEGDLPLRPELDRAGIAWEPAIWSDPGIDWQSFDAAVVRSTWDYFERFGEFCRWLERMRREGVRLLNPVSVIETNFDKVYLRELAARGVSTVPTCWVAPGTPPAEVHQILAGLEWDELVAKPSVSGGAYRTERTTLSALRGQAEPLAEILADSHALVQPYLPEIAEAGEWSFLFFGDEFSHSVLKIPRAGDFRVQEQYGGKYHAAPPPPGILGQATDALRVCRTLPGGEGEMLYARVDGVVLGDRFVVVEVELIEPSLFFAQDPASPGRFVRELSRLLDGPGRCA